MEFQRNTNTHEHDTGTKMNTRRGDGPMANKICTQAAPPKKSTSTESKRTSYTLNTLSYSRPIIGPIVRFGPRRKRRVQKRDASSLVFYKWLSPFEKTQRRDWSDATNSESCTEDWNSAKYLYTTLSISRVRCCFTTRPSCTSQPVFNGYRVIKLLPRSSYPRKFSFSLL